MEKTSKSRERFWKLRKGRKKLLRKGRVVIGPKKVTINPRRTDRYWRLSSAQMAEHTKHKWKGSLGRRLEPLPDNCFVSPDMAQWLFDQLNMQVAT